MQVSGQPRVGPPSDPRQNFLGFMLYDRAWFAHDISVSRSAAAPWTTRGVISCCCRRSTAPPPSSGTPYFTENPGDEFKAWDLSLTFDYMPDQFTTFRFEVDHRESNVPYFSGRGPLSRTVGGNQGQTVGSLFVPGFFADLRRRRDAPQPCTVGQDVAAEIPRIRPRGMVAHSVAGSSLLSDTRTRERPVAGPALGLATLAALGVVFGDLGTSPLYAMQEAFHGRRGVAPTPENVLGIASLFLWSLVLMVSLKYVAVLMRAGNRGEGGVLALLALFLGDRIHVHRAKLVITLGLFGSAMLYGDGVITPAISVLSAVEGIQIATPAFQRFVVPLTIVILVGLFSLQRRGTGRVGRIFGPILGTWFVVIAILGVHSIAQNPVALEAINPWYAVRFFSHAGPRGFLALGAVVLCLTGGEALYADMGHFGPRPIRIAWFALALPALTLNYLGQAALLLQNPGAASRPFYSMVPEWALYPMVALATAATIIASQALIAAVFSLTRQAAQLGFGPRVNVVHTSGSSIGQIYLPSLNWLLVGGDGRRRPRVPIVRPVGRGVRPRGLDDDGDHHDSLRDRGALEIPLATLARGGGRRADSSSRISRSSSRTPSSSSTVDGCRSSSARSCSRRCRRGTSASGCCCE